MIIDNFYSLDMQIDYWLKKARKRVIYYVARALGKQVVKEHRYDKLNNVVVTFIYNENTTSKSFVTRVELKNQDNEVYSELLTLYEININREIEEEYKELGVVKDFLLINSLEDLEQYKTKYTDHPIASILVKRYKYYIENQDIRKMVRGSDYMSYRYSEAERENVLKEGKEEERERVILNMHKEGFTLKQICLATQLSMEDVEYILSNREKW